MTLDDEDITDAPLDVTAGNITGVRVVLTDKLTGLAGRVAGSRGEPLKDYVVVVQPSEPKEGWAAVRYIRTGRPDQDGRFDINALPPGRYVATVVETLEQGREWDPNFQKQLRDAGRDFALRDGETLTLDLKMSTVTY